MPKGPKTMVSGTPPREGRAGKDLVLVGVVGAPHGVRGEVRLKSFTEDPAAAGDYGPVQAEDGRSFALEVLRSLKDDMVVARIAGVDDRDAAAALTHLRLFVPRDRLPPPEEDEFYASDLVGLAVVDGSGEALGSVKAVVDYGAGDILEIDRPGGSAVLLPFTKAFVPRVDIAAGRIVVDPPAGIFDADDEAGPGDGPPEAPARAGKVGKGRKGQGATSAEVPAGGSSDVPPAPTAPAPAPGGKRSRW